MAGKSPRKSSRPATPRPATEGTSSSSSKSSSVPARLTIPSEEISVARVPTGGIRVYQLGAGLASCLACRRAVVGIHGEEGTVLFNPCEAEKRALWMADLSLCFAPSPPDGGFHGCDRPGGR